VDASGNGWLATHDFRGNMLTLRDPLDQVQSWTYSPVNTVTSHTDAELNVIRYYYDDPAYRTLLTRIVEPNVSGSPPAGQLPGQEGTFPVTRLGYYLGQTGSCDSAGSVSIGSCRGQLKEVTDPNGVWTGFEYDQWGQPFTYSEGRIQSQTASTLVIIKNTTYLDSGSRIVSSSVSGAGCGSTNYNPGNDPISSTCLTCGAAAEAAASAVPQGFPPLPCNAASLPVVSATFSGAVYSPKGELLTFPLSINASGGPYTRTQTAAFDRLGRQTDGSVTSNEYGSSTSISRGFHYVPNWGTGMYTRTGPDGPNGQGGSVTTTQVDAANRVLWVERRASAGGAVLMRADYTYFNNDQVQSVIYNNGTSGNGASTWYTYDAARRVTRIEHRAPGGAVMLALDYAYYANDLPQTITESGATVTTATGTTFTYDRRRRLTDEQRTGSNPYHFAYGYDKGWRSNVSVNSALA
jgi:hypothetical protein